MKIGIDAKWFFTGPPSGRRVVRNLIFNLANVDKINNYYIILRNADKTNIFPFSQNNFHLTYVWAKNNFLSNLFCIRKKARELHLDVVVFQNYSSPSRKYRSSAFVYDALFESYPQYFSFIERIYYKLIKPLARKADLICTISESERKRLLNYNFNGRGKSIDVVYMGVDEKFVVRDKIENSRIVQIKSKYTLPDEYLLFVGRLNIRKNIINLLRAIPLLANKSIPLVIVGEPNWKTDNLDRTISDLGIKGRICFTGYVEEENLPLIFSLAKIFCFPSFAEGFGLPAIEAMASGVPVVVSNIPVMQEICGDAGNYINPYDPSDIACTIDSLLQDSEKYEIKKERGMKYAKKFSWNRSAQMLLNSIGKMKNHNEAC